MSLDTNLLLQSLDTDLLLKAAEHMISYSSKRAIEMYLPVWKKEPALYLFDRCAKHYGLRQGEIEKCKGLMAKFGMHGVSDE